MRTVCGLGRRIQVALGGDRRPEMAAPQPLSPAGCPLLPGGVGEQRRHGVLLDQVDGVTCGSVVLVALAAWADPTELGRLDGAPGFGLRFDARQRQVHSETNRFWPRALGTTPWGMTRWIRGHVPEAGRYRVRLVDDASQTDVAAMIDEAGAALGADRPVPLLVGSLIPRHWVLALGPGGRGWRVYEPSSGSVRAVDPALVRARRLRPVLGFERLHAALLPYT